MKHTGDYELDEINMLEQECSDLEEENKRLEEENKKLKEENKKLKHENKYRAGIVDILPKWKGHIAEETIQDLQARINELKEELESTQKEFQQYKEHYNIEKDKQQIFLMTWRKY